MAGPWEKYATQATPADSAPPWEKYGGAAAPAKAATGLEKLPPESPSAAPAQENHDDIAHRILGLGEAGLSTATGALGPAAGQLYGIGKTLTSGKYGTQAGIQEGEKAGTELASKLTYQPRTQTGKDINETAGKLLEQSRLQGLPVEGGMIGRLPEVPRQVLGAGEALGETNRAIGRTAAMPAQALGRKAVGMLPDLDPATKQLAQDAHGMGFRLSPHEVYGNRYGKFAGELAEDNPLIKTNKEHNENIFNRRLVEAVGGTGDNLTRQTFANSMKKAGETIGGIAEKHDVPFNDNLVNKLASHVDEAQKFQTADVSKVVESYANEITDKAKGGVLPGKAFRAINTKLNTQIRNTQNGDLKSALSGLQDDLQEQFVGQLNQRELAAYNKARYNYSVGKTLEPLVAKSPTGKIAPASLLGAITRTGAGKSAVARGAAGDLGKLADIGQRFLKSQPSSGTAERTFMQNLATHPIGTLASGATALGTAPLAAGYNRLGPQVTQQLLDRPPQP